MADGDQWEVVRGRRERAKPEQDLEVKKPEPKPNKTNRSKSNKESNKENEVLRETSKTSKPKKATEKRTNDTEKSKIKPPKSLEQALAMINEADFKNLCDTSSLLNITRFLNCNVTVDQNDETYSKLPINYPISSVPSALKRAIERAIKRESQSDSIHYCLENCLSSIAHDMAKDLPVVGLKIMVQIIAYNDAMCFVKCIPKLNNLMNAYQNRPSIVHALLWAIGQGGLQNFGVGVQVWKEVMVPLIDMKHYHKYVSNYLVILLSAHMKNNEKPLTIEPFEFQELFELVHTKRKSLPKEFEKILLAQSFILRELYFEKSDSWKKFNFMDKLFNELPDVFYEKTYKYEYKTEEILRCIMNALAKDEANYKNLKTLRSKYVKGSTHVVGFVEREWKSISPKLNKNSLQKYLSESKMYYEELYRKDNKDHAIKGILKSCQNISAKSSASSTSSAKSKSRGFPWIAGCLFLLVAVTGALVAYDITLAGTYSASYTSVVAQKSLEHIQCATTKGLTVSARGYKWAEKNFPGYYATVVEFSKPYVVVACDLFKVTINGIVQGYGNAKEYAVDAWPKVYSTVDYYAPGYLDIIWNYITVAWNFVVEFFHKYYNIILTYLKTEVFIDNWAPQILQEKTFKAFNATQIYAVEYYNWFYKHVDDYSKL